MLMKKRFVHNYVELAKALGISRGGLQRFRQLPKAPRPRSDGRHCVKTWAAFISANATKIATGTSVLPLGPKDAKRISLMDVQIQREQVKLERERRDIDKLIYERSYALAQDFKGRIDHLFQRELPVAVAERPIHQVAKICNTKINQLWNEYSSDIFADLRSQGVELHDVRPAGIPRRYKRNGFASASV
jgi:hypothetical protein